MLTLNDIYTYIFSDHAKINDSAVPQNKRNDIRTKIENIIKNKFSTILNKPIRNAFRKLLRKLNNSHLEKILFNNSSDPLDVSDVNFPTDGEIKEKFESINSHYLYYTNSAEIKQAKNAFIMFFKACKITADYVECNNAYSDNLACVHAYKILVLFSQDKENINIFSSFDKYLHIFCEQKSKHPVHDALLKEIPINKPPLKLTHWRKMIWLHGPAVLSLFQLATDIRQLLHKDPQTFDEVKNAVSQLRYQRYDEYPELAELCSNYHVSEANYNKCLDHFEPKRKSKDQMPEANINGAEFNFPGYHLVKLPHNDPRVYVIGHLTDCCLNVGGGSEQCIYDCISKENCGIYVLLKARDMNNLDKPLLDDGAIDHVNYDIVGCGYAWLGQMDSLTIDSWDNLRPEADNKVIVALLRKFSQQAAKSSNIRRVTIGVGGKTPTDFSTLTHPDIMREGIQYPDSYKQALIYVDNKVNEEARKQRDKIMRDYSKAKISEFIQRPLFEKLIDIAASSVYLEWISKFFLGANSHALWMDLLEKNQNNLEGLIKCMKEQGPSFLELLLQIHELELLDENTYQLILGDSAQSMLMRTALACLKEENITLKDSELFCKMLVILTNTNQVESAAELAGRLYNARLFTYSMLELIINHTQNIALANIILAQLEGANLLNNDVLVAVGKNLAHITRIRLLQILLRYCEKPNKNALLQSINIIADNSIEVNQLWGRLQPVLQTDLFNNEILQLFIANENNTVDIELILHSLQLANLLTQENLRDTLNAAAQGGKKLKNALNIADGLKRLVAINLTGGMTIKIINANAKYADDFSCGLADLYEASRHHVGKDIFKNFIEFYRTNTTLTNRADIVTAWADKYITEHDENPFILLRDKYKSSAQALFSLNSKDPVKIFNTFMFGNEIPAALANLMNSSLVRSPNISP